jgi:diguanylate cyclase (GGDEF)-like protein
VNWNELPDLAAFALLTGAFASVSRRSPTTVSGIWLIGWVMIVYHFAASLFMTAPGIWGILAGGNSFAALTWAGLLFMWASVPYRQEASSRWMLTALGGSTTLYIVVIFAGPAASWVLNTAAVLMGALPLLTALVALRRFNHPLRWVVVILYCALSIFLLLFQHRPGNGTDLAENAILFTVFFGCCIHFWYMYRRTTAGAFITIAGFLAWALVFVVSPLMAKILPGMHVESEVWNLPKYVVAVGMILLLLEDQIEHTKRLALYDHLTGLANRRYFQYRLDNALKRARRNETQTALLLVDLNRFKQVNDSFGHHVGDLVLQQVGSILAGRVRSSDTVARTGGDEFSVILEEPTNRSAAELVRNALLQLLNQSHQLEGHTVRIGASIGIALFPEDARDMESLSIAADQRMYDAKRVTEKMEEVAASSAAFPLPALKSQAQAIDDA